MIVPVILCGGAGTRLWPVSREGHPKPFMRLPDGESLLLKSYRRAAQLPHRGGVVTVTNRDYFFLCKDEVERAKLGPGLRTPFILEPEGRNTAPAVAAAALQAAEALGPEAVLLVMAADHLIEDETAFAAATREAAALAQQGLLVTFGIAPSAPETGFGYLECGQALGANDAWRVSRFVEKPDRAKAEAYLTRGGFLWNSGMFCFKAGTVLDELERCAPQVIGAVRECWARSAGRNPLTDVVELEAESFAQAPAISFDYAVMEKSDRVAVVKAELGWSDVGSWTAVGALVEPDAQGNRVIGEAVAVQARGNFIHSEGRLVAALGVEDLMIVDTPDALLVAPKGRDQDVKLVVEALKQREHESYRLHRTVVRPWGTYTVLEEGPRFKIKRIVVKPGGALSLQMHHHRSEHWIVVSGIAKVVRGEHESFVNTNESTFIAPGHKHRLANPGLLDLVLIEVQSGEYLGEDDIVRFEDRYGRVAEPG